MDLKNVSIAHSLVKIVKSVGVKNPEKYQNMRKIFTLKMKKLDFYNYVT